MTNTNCVVGSITPYVPSESMPWNRTRALHLYRRMGFGASQQEIEAALQKDPTALVDEIIDAAMILPLPEEPDWGNWALSDYNGNVEQAIDQVKGWTYQWLDDMIKHGFREKLALFWHNHFVTQIDSYNCPSYLYQYHRLLQEYALGDFKTFVKKMGTTPAMLIYLNGVQNTRFEPNENYARELYELFTLGRDNGYTQSDIVNTAKALTGYNGFTEACATIGYVDGFHDPSSKTIFGKTDTYDYDKLHDLLFEERSSAIATFICTKIYRHFVNPQVDENIVASLAQTFLASQDQGQFPLAPVFRQLFKSEHFFDDLWIHEVSINLRTNKGGYC
ncbi:MAG: DUF1800 family protein [Bacteroidota bacterium]